VIASSSADLPSQINANKQTASSLQSEINAESAQIGKTANGVAAAKQNLDIAQARLVTQSQALAYGFSRGFLVSAAITLLTVVVALVMLRVKREDLAGINPMAAPSD